MAPREHDAWEGAGARPWDYPEQGPHEDADNVSPADQWFGGGMLPPPPPYAQPADGQPAPPPIPQAPPETQAPGPSAMPPPETQAPEPPAMPPDTPTHAAGANGEAPVQHVGPPPHVDPPQYFPDPPQPEPSENQRLAAEEQREPTDGPWTGASAFGPDQPLSTLASAEWHTGGTQGSQGYAAPADHGRAAEAEPNSFTPDSDIPEAEPLPPLDSTGAPPQDHVPAPPPPPYSSAPIADSSSGREEDSDDGAPQKFPEPGASYASPSPDPGTDWHPEQATAVPPEEIPSPPSDASGGPPPGYDVELPVAEEADWRQISLNEGTEDDVGPQPRAPHASPATLGSQQGPESVDGVLHAPAAPSPADAWSAAPSGPQAPNGPEETTPTSGPPQWEPAAAQWVNGGQGAQPPPQQPPPPPQPPPQPPPVGPSPVVSSEPAAAQWANGGQGAPPPQPPPGGAPGPQSGSRPSPPPGQNPYDWRPQGGPNAPQSGPQMSAEANAQGVAAPQAAHGSTVEPQAPPAAGGRPNPYQVPGQPPPAAHPGNQAPSTHREPPPHGQQAPPPPPPPPPGPAWGPPQSTAAPDASPAGAPGFQYHTHLPQQGVDESRPETAETLDPDTLVRGKRQSTKGWRKVVRSATFGLVNPGLSAAETRRHELTNRATTHVAGGHHRVAVLSLKGGVGKTTTTVALGSTLSTLRGDRVLAVDANPDRGTLSDKVRLETRATIRDLLNERDQITRYADIRGFTSQAASRLEILASDRDPAVSEAFSENDYREVTRLLEHFYSICITDCGTGLLHSAMRGVLGLADQVVLVSSASVDGARSASATLDWLQAHEYGYHVRGAVVVLSMVRQDGKSTVDLDRLEEHFASRCRAVVRVPWDSHLEEGAEVDLERLAPATRDAYLQLGATVGEAFAWPS